MKNFSFNSIVLGFIFGTIGITTVFAAGGIKSAVFSSSKVYLSGQKVPLKSSLVAIVKDGSENTQMYMPVRELLEYLNFDVNWNPEDESIDLTANTNYDTFDYKLKVIDFFSRYLDIDLNGNSDLLRYDFYSVDNGTKNLINISWAYEHTTYYANLTINGDIVDFGIIHDDDNIFGELIELEKAKGIANQFIASKNLTATFGDLTYMGESTVSPTSTMLVYSYHENKTICIYVSSEREKVVGFSLKSLQEGKDTIKGGVYRETGVVG